MKTALFCDRLTHAMETAGIRAAELCRICSISKSTMSQYISGKYLPKHDRVVQMAKALNCSAAWLSGHDTPMVGSDSCSTEAGNIPVLGSVSLNEGCLFSDDSVIGYELAESTFCDGHHFVIIASDDSMDPMIMEGDHVLCERLDQLQSGQTGVFILPDGKAVIRTFELRDGISLLISSNRYYPPQKFDGSTGVRIVGKVIRSTRYW